MNRSLKIRLALAALAALALAALAGLGVLALSKYPTDEPHQGIPAYQPTATATAPPVAFTDCSITLNTPKEGRVPHLATLGCDGHATVIVHGNFAPNITNRFTPEIDGGLTSIKVIDSTEVRATLTTEEGDTCTIIDVEGQNGGEAPCVRDSYTAEQTSSAAA